jgi:hypothetical protein
MHDPVSPIVVKPAIIGWDAKERKVELQIDRAFTGEELVIRMQGWVTVDPSPLIDVIGRYGRLKVLDERDLVVELEDEKGYKKLQRELLDGTRLSFPRSYDSLFNQRAAVTVIFG